MLEISGLDVDIGAAAVLRGVEIAIPAGAICGLIGRNGAGKTTLMRSLMGVLPLRAGTISLDARDIGRDPPHRRAALGFGYMPEDRRLVPELTVEENILLPALATARADRAGRLGRVYELIPELAAIRARRATILSGGQQKLAALARALIGGTRVLVLDEPTEGVAPAIAHRIGAILAGLGRREQIVLIAESNAKHLAGIADRLYLIERGRVTRQGA